MLDTIPSDYIDGLVYIILPVYNREDYLPAALESILKQTYPNYELIAVDDGSIDSSYEILKGFAYRFKGRLTIIRQENKGPSYARNRGIQAAQGEYIAFLDSDDFWREDKLQKQVDLFRAHRNVAFIYSGYYLVDEKGKIIGEYRPDPRFSGNIYDKLWKYENNISGGTIFVERSKIVRAGMFDPELRGAENLDLRLRLSRLGTVYFIDECLYFYRRHHGNLTVFQTEMQNYHRMLLSKHSSELKREGYLFRIANARLLYKEGMQEFSIRRYRSALGKFIKSIYWCPFFWESYLQAIRCCLGKRANNLLSYLGKEVLGPGKTMREYDPDNF